MYIYSLFKPLYLLAFTDSFGTDETPTWKDLVCKALFMSIYEC